MPNNIEESLRKDEKRHEENNLFMLCFAQLYDQCNEGR